MNTTRRLPHVHYTFEHDKAAARAARRLMSHMCDLYDDDLSMAIQLAVSELVANVYHHTDDGGALNAWHPSDITAPVRLEVEDHSFDNPAISTSAPTAIGGRGLHLINAVSDSWGFHPTPSGKVVWAEFYRSG